MTVEQTIPMEPAPKPNGQTNGHARVPVSADTLADDLLGILASEEPSNDNAADAWPEKKPAKAKREERREADDGADEEVEELESRRADGGEEDEGEDVAEGESADEAEEGAHARGSEDNPFTVKDLPTKAFIELKVDGETLKIPLRELADGYIREKTFSARINRTKAMTEQAEALIGEVRTHKEELRRNVLEFLKDPDQLFEYFTADAEREQTAVLFGQRLAEMLRRFRENPHERVAYERQRDRARLEKERAAWQEQQRAEAQKRAHEEALKQARAVWDPGWADGLKRAGFPTPTQALRDEVLIRCQQVVRSGGQPTSDDIAEFVVRAAKLLELPKRGGQKLRPAPSKPVERREAASRGRKDWSKVPAHERRKNPDFFLDTLRSKDFR